MKVAILIPKRSGGGAEFVALQWADYLRGSGHPTTVITTHEKPGAEDSDVVSVSAASFPGRAVRLRQHVRDADYDVLLALMPHWNLLGLLSVLGRRRRPAVVISGRNMEHALLAANGLAYRIELGLARLLYPRADGYVAISHPVAAEAAKTYRFPADKVWVVPNPATGKLGSGVPSPTAPYRRDARQRHVTLTVPARLVRQKRPEVAVETAAVLARHGVASTVEYFGVGPEEAQVRAAADRLGVTVRFRGWEQAWFEQLASDAVVLLPSIAEGFGNVLVEAAAVGIPSVSTSRALGVADAIVPGVTGVLAMGSSPADFADAVVEAVRLSPVSAPNWLRRFSPEESGRRLLQVLTAVVEKRQGGRADVPVEAKSASTEAEPDSTEPVYVRPVAGAVIR